MRKRSGQVHSRESSATLQLTVSLLYLWQFPRLAAGAERGTIKQKLLQRVFSGGEREDKMRLVRQLDQRF